jgi:hypothetical protein
MGEQRYPVFANGVNSVCEVLVGSSAPPQAAHSESAANSQ